MENEKETCPYLHVSKVGKWSLETLSLRDGLRILRVRGPNGHPIDLHPRMPKEELESKLKLIPNYIWKDRRARSVIHEWIMSCWTR